METRGDNQEPRQPLLRVLIKISSLLPSLSHFPGVHPSFSVLQPSGSLLLASLSTANSKWRRRPYIIRNPLSPPRHPSSTPSTLGKTARQGWGRRTMAPRTPYAASTSRNSTNKLKSRIFRGPKPSATLYGLSQGLLTPRAAIFSDKFGKIADGSGRSGRITALKIQRYYIFREDYYLIIVIHILQEVKESI